MNPHVPSTEKYEKYSVPSTEKYEKIYIFTTIITITIIISNEKIINFLVKSVDPNVTLLHLFNKCILSNLKDSRIFIGYINGIAPSLSYPTRETQA